MAEATTTNHFRRRLAKHMFDESALPKIGMMAFGDGGHNTDGTPKAPSADRTALVNERIRKVLVSVAQEDQYSVTAIGRLAKSDLVGVSVSEAGLLDTAGNLLGFRNFAPKIKEADEEYEVRIKLKF